MRHKRTRPAFTLVELLVVIAIIAILVGLISAAIFYAINQMRDVGARNDMSSLAASLQSFKNKFGVYPLSRIRLCSTRATYTKNPTPAANGGPELDLLSVTFIDQLWPQIGDFTNVKWDGASTNLDVILEGDQSMVYFLAGIPNGGPGGIGTGFSINQKDPSSLTSSRVGPFFDFGARLYLRPGATNNFGSFKDYYNKQPYLYFSAGNRKNGYAFYQSPRDPYYVQIQNTSNTNIATVMPYFQSGTIKSPIAPTPPNKLTFQLSNVLYWAPDSFQIMCAGRDGDFNSVSISAAYDTPGAFLWNPTTAASIPLPGRDDQTTFYGTLMGTAQ
jgi:general secretion pathway protein G